MAGFNKIIVLGRVGRDPEEREVAGKKVAKFSVVTSYKGRDGEVSTWFSVEAWEKTAEIVMSYVKKGDNIYIEGLPKIESWTDKDGNTKTAFGVKCTTLQLLGGRSDTTTTTTTTVENTPATSGDDLPF